MPEATYYEGDDGKIYGMPTTAPTDAEEQADAWLERLQALAEEAKSEGVTLAYCLHIYDPISEQSHAGWGFGGDLYAATGLVAKYARVLMEG